MSKKQKKQKVQETKNNNQPDGPEPRGLRERVKGGWVTASEALAELKVKDPSPRKSIVNWLIRKKATG